MARRRRDYNDGERARINPLQFVTQGQEGGGGTLASLMALLGLKNDEEEKRQGLEQQALQAYYEGKIAEGRAGTETEREKLRMAREEAIANAKERTEAAKDRSAAELFRQQQTARATQAQEDTLAANTLKEIMDSDAFTKAEKRAAALRINPRARAGVEEELERVKKERKEEFKTGLEKSYKGGPKEIGAYLKSQEATPGIQEIMRDPSIDWQKLNQGMPAPEPGILGKLFGSSPASMTGVGAQYSGPVEFLRSLVGGGGPATPYGAPPVGGAAPWRYGTGTIPTESAAAPVAVPEAGFEYLPGYPSAKPDYMYGIKTPIPADVINRIEGDPRYRSAEQDVLLAIKDWWNRPSEPREPISAAPSQVTPYRYGVGSQAAPPVPEIPVTQTAAGPSFMDIVREAFEPAQGRYPKTAEIPIRELPPELLGQPQGRPFGVR